MLSLAHSFRLFNEGLDRRLLWTYWLAFKEKGWEVFWGPTLLGVVFGIYTLWHSPALPWFLGYVLAVAFATGYYLWRVNHIRLEQKITITRVTVNPWTDERGECVGYAFEVLNKSEGSSISRVRVELDTIEPEVRNLNWLPVLLQQKHDNPTPGKPHVPAREFDLNPRQVKQVDFVSSWQGNSQFTIHHIAGVGINSRVPIAQGFKYRLKVIVTAKDMPKLSQWFEVWTNEEDVLQCKMEPMTNEQSQKNSTL